MRIGIKYKDFTKEEKAEYQRAYHLKNKEKRNQKAKQNYIKNKERYSERGKANYQKDKEPYRVRRRRNQKIRSQKPEYRIINNLRVGIYCAISGKKKYKKTLEYLGCSISEFKDRLSGMFADGMSWENYGKIWHLDHIVPVSSFDFNDEHSQRICFHYSNMQPMFAVDNMKKSNKILSPTQIQIPLCTE